MMVIHKMKQKIYVYASASLSLYTIHAYFLKKLHFYTDSKRCYFVQETVGYFFCLEDRALLCRKCDISIHTANAYVSAHQRFLLTGVKVGLEPINPAASASSGKSHSVQKVEEQESPPISKRTAPVSSNAVCNDVLPVQTSGVEDFAPSSLPLVGGSTAGIIPQWQFDEFLGMGDFNQNYGYMDYGSSKV